MTPFSLDEQLQHPLHQLYLIEASAGTGKTYTIANLYLRHVLAAYRVSQILVVTFTNAATDELRGRIRAKLYAALQYLETNQAIEVDPFTEKILQQYKVEDARAHLELAIHSMDEAAIFTIHGFCQRALKEFAFLSGQSFNLELNQNEDELLLPVAKDWWRCSVYQAEKFQYQVAKAAWNNDIDKFYQQIKTLISRDAIITEIENSAISTQNIDIAALYTQLSTCFFEYQQDIYNALLQSTALKKIGKYRKDRLAVSFSKIRDWLENPHSLQPLPQLEVLTQTYLSSQVKKGFEVDNALLIHPLFKLGQQYSDSYPQVYKYALNQLIANAMQFIKEQGSDIKKDAHVLSFDDLLSQLNQALSESSDDALAQGLRQRYPIAMIDEFQDTDPVQYGIFKQLYVGQDHTTFYMIGDPKQAIYSFRGGDIYTYLQAKQDVKQHQGTIYTLNENWRSNPKMLNAVNHFFQYSDNPFLHKDISFEVIKTPKEKIDHKLLRINGEIAKPLNFWLSPDAEISPRSKSPALNKETAREYIDTAICKYIAYLLAKAQQQRVTLGDKTLKASDIAVLVPKHSDAERLRSQLSALGVSSTTMGKKTVFESAEAQALQQLLYTVQKPKQRSLLRQALANPLLAYRYDTIDQQCNSEQFWLEWMERFNQLHLQWLNQGFMSMFLSLVEQLTHSQTFKQQGEADRSMTNLLQLGELLQYASKQYTDMHALITWFEQQCLDPSGEEAELRLESDADSVKLVTLFAAKGLEYGIVFLPYLWDLRNIDKNSPIFYHNENQQLQADIGADTNSEEFKQHLYLADHERIAEQCRLIYVALTRSVACCHVVWGNIGKLPYGCSDNSALGYLLHSKQSAEDLQNKPLSCLARSSWSKGEIAADLDNLLQTSEDNITIAALGELNQHSFNDIFSKNTIESEIFKQDEGLENKHFTRSLSNPWRIVSFSSLSKNISHQRHYIEAINTDKILNFPTGKRTGLYLHRLLEYIDFKADIKAQVDQLNQRLLPRYGLSLEDYNQTTQDWLYEVINAPLNASGLKLSELSKQQCLHEMDFHFSIQQSSHDKNENFSYPVNKVNIQKLNQLFSQYAKQPLQAITQANFQGLVNGVIDLIFEYQGRYYLVDYKSNYLGNCLDNYHHPNMHTEIYSRRYDLQYMLYSIALHRFLQNRLPDYNYETHFGGVYYLYLRGMRIENETGVFFTVPESCFIEQLNHLF